MDKLFSKERDVLNGRVDIMNIKSEPQWPLFQQNNSGAKNYKEEALKGIQTKSQLSQVFFSKKNIDLIQNQIRYNVWLQSNKTHVIGRQSDTELEIVMRSIYLQYSKNLPYNIKEQIEELNAMILDYCIPNILSEIEQYLAYKVNVSQLPQPIARPESLTSAGSKTLVLNNFF
jgi:hypothetical protein